MLPTRTTDMPLINKINTPGATAIDHWDYSENIEFAFELDSVTEPLAFQIDDNTLLIGYLSHDEDVANPFADFEDGGPIFSTHRDAGRDQHKAFFLALGKDAYGDDDPDILPNPYAVRLDCYQHSGTAWAPSGSTEARNFPDQQFDVGHGVGVWVPDDYRREECDRRAEVYAFFAIKKENTREAGVSDDRYQLVLNNNSLVGIFPDWRQAFAAAQEQVREFKASGAIASPAQLEAGKTRAKVELAGADCETVNQWSNGDAYGVIIATYKRDDEDEDEDEWQVEESDECWGYLGGDYAISELTEQFKTACDNLAEENGHSMR